MPKGLAPYKHIGEVYSGFHLNDVYHLLVVCAKQDLNKCLEQNKDGEIDPA